MTIPTHSSITNRLTIVFKIRNNYKFLLDINHFIILAFNNISGLSLLLIICTDLILQYFKVHKVYYTIVCKKKVSRQILYHK